MDHGLTKLDVLERLLNFFLERGLEVELVHGVQRHDRVQQVIGIETLGAYLFFAFQTEQNKVLNMLTALVLHFDRIVHAFLGLSFLLYRAALDGFLRLRLGLGVNALR